MKDDVSSFVINPLRNHLCWNCLLPKITARLEIGDNQPASDLSALTHSECIKCLEHLLWIKYTEMFLWKAITLWFILLTLNVSQRRWCTGRDSESEKIIRTIWEETSSLFYSIREAFCLVVEPSGRFIDLLMLTRGFFFQWRWLDQAYLVCF